MHHFSSSAALLIALVLLCPSNAQDELIIQTTNGRVRGLRLPAGDGYVMAFLGIPYAEPPIQNLRFRRPVPHKPWAGIWGATNFSNTCHQQVDLTFPGFPGAQMWNPNTKMSEDCLYLNIWVPLPKPRRAPVMVWIYGGGYSTGSASLAVYDGRYLSQAEGVVVVSMNYRLGPLGFLALPGNTDIAGNAGLFDQRLAIQWVAENIASFGGDRESVTLFGESAGAASVSCHLLSHGSHSFFTRAILQSGSLNAPWAVVTPTEAWNRSLTLAKLLGCSTSNLEFCLLSLPPEDIVNKQLDVVNPAPLVGIFGPTVDGDFFTDLPEVLIQSGQFKKTDLLLGVNKDEGSYFLMYGAPGFSLNHDSLITRENFLKGIALALPKFSKIMQEAVDLHYTDWTDVSNMEKNRDALSQLVGDYDFTCPLLNFGKKFAGFGHKAFFYYFDHRSSRNPWPEWMGVMHGYEIEFVFGLPLNKNLGYTEEEVAMSRRIMRHWANFARNGNPSIQASEWPPFTQEKQEYFILNTMAPRVHQMLKAQKCKMWDSFISKLQILTVGVDEVELQWKNQFHQWISYMLDWRNQFNEYNVRSQKCETLS